MEIDVELLCAERRGDRLRGKSFSVTDLLLNGLLLVFGALSVAQIIEGTRQTVVWCAD